MTESPEPDSSPGDRPGGCRTSLSSDHTEVTTLLCEIEVAEHDIQQLRAELSQEENSMQMLLSHMNEMEKKKGNLIKELEKLRQFFDSSDHRDAIGELMMKLELLKALEREESYLRSFYKNACVDLQPEPQLEKKVPHVDEERLDLISFTRYLSDSLDRLHLAKRELAAKLREVLSLKRQYDDMPTQTELIQYERRFSELYAQIQEKHRQTCDHYATYNALLEIKELMLKEISLLNSIDAQFQDAMSSPIGRSKLVDSMELIVKGTKQKLEKVQLTLIEEQRICSSLKEKHVIAVADQHHFSSLLKAFQEECARNRKLTNLAST